ncbi:MAG: DUF6029 family protein [Candidatus Latescibacterota bacterium]
MPRICRSARALVLPIFSLVFALAPGTPEAQLRLSSLSEMQIGNLPERKPRDLRTLYHQFNLGYSLDHLRIGVRSEAFGSSESGRSYGEILQRFITYRRANFQATLGHFYTIVGSGLLAHAFELPGVITEQRGSRRRYQIVRDLDGIHLRYGLPWGRIQLLRGAPVNSDLPPGLKGVNRRQGTIQGGTLTLQPRSYLDTELSLLDYDTGEERELGLALGARLRLETLLSSLGLDGIYADLYGEYARRNPDSEPIFSMSRDRSRALYLSSTITVGAWGLSLEFKDYRNFALTQINNPPPLIREHSAYLLNRITHDLLPDDERGFQGELSYATAGGYVLTANWTHAVRQLAPGRADDRSLSELFLQLNAPLGDFIEAQFFVDVNRNQILDDQRHRIVGTLWNWSINTHYSLDLDVQFQDVDRRFGVSEYPYSNLYLNFAAHRTSGISAALSIERSTDVLATGANPSGTTWWRGLSLNADLGSNHNVHIFTGQRRAGLACSAGTCYEILGFEGVEIRLHNRFF